MIHNYKKIIYNNSLYDKLKIIHYEYYTLLNLLYIMPNFSIKIICNKKKEYSSLMYQVALSEITNTFINYIINFDNDTIEYFL